MGDRDDLVLFGFEGRLDLIHGNNTPNFGSQGINLSTVCFQARVEESVSIEVKLRGVSSPIGEGVTEVASVQNQSIFTWLDQVRSDLLGVKPRSAF